MIPETSALQAIALAGQGQNVSEIARHLGHDRKTIRIVERRSGIRCKGLSAVLKIPMWRVPACS